MHHGIYEHTPIVVSLNGAYAYAKIPSDDHVWSWKPHSTIPGQLKMNARAGSDMLSEHPDLYVKQARRNLFKELIGYENNSEFHIATLQNRGANIMYARDDSSFWTRFFYLNLHPWDISVWHGDSPVGVKLADYHRPVRCPQGPMKCCCHQQIQHKDTNGVSIGATIEDFYYCVPKFNVLDSLGNVDSLYPIRLVGTVDLSTVSMMGSSLVTFLSTYTRQLPRNLPIYIPVICIRVR
jgi:hypothetical protein